MTTQLAVLSRQATILSAVFGLCASVGCVTTGGSPPPCPAPSEPTIVDIHDIVQEAVARPPRYAALMTWIAEIERFCTGLDAFRRG